MTRFKTLEDKIRYEEKQPTTFDQLRYALKNDVTIFDYTDLANINNIERLFENSLNVIRRANRAPALYKYQAYVEGR